jgi:predicted RNase H-like HicB family nuclease
MVILVRESEKAAMLIHYIQSAMRLAKYEILEDKQYYGEIPGFDGVWAQAPTLETCREELQSALEDWLILGLRRGHKLPVVDGIQLVPEEA